MVFNLRTIFSDILVVRQIYFHVKNFSGALFSVPFAVCRWLKMLESDTEKNQRPFGLSRVGQKEIKIYFTK